MYSVEHLRTHSHCWECCYSPELETKLRIRKNIEDDFYTGYNFQENELTEHDLPDDDEIRQEIIK